MRRRRPNMIRDDNRPHKQRIFEIDRSKEGRKEEIINMIKNRFRGTYDVYISRKMPKKQQIEKHSIYVVEQRMDDGALMFTSTVAVAVAFNEKLREQDSYLLLVKLEAPKLDKDFVMLPRPLYFKYLDGRLKVSDNHIRKLDGHHERTGHTTIARNIIDEPVCGNCNYNPRQRSVYCDWCGSYTIDLKNLLAHAVKTDTTTRSQYIEDELVETIGNHIMKSHRDQLIRLLMYRDEEDEIYESSTLFHLVENGMEWSA